MLKPSFITSIKGWIPERAKHLFRIISKKSKMYKAQFTQYLSGFVPLWLKMILRTNRDNSTITKWVRSGCPVPPPHIIKQLTIKEYQGKFGIEIFIETGTYLGAMVESVKDTFRKIYSIELSHQLYKMAKIKFRDCNQISLIQGDSGKMLPQILEEIRDTNLPAIFWLDGHYSYGITARGDSDCPVLEELDVIFKFSNQKNIILIDDARCFSGSGDYPSIPDLKDFLLKRNPDIQIEVKNDIIRLTPG
jgi:hypothetical protein